MTYEKRWDEKTWAGEKVRRAQMKCGVWRVQCEVWGVKSAVWRAKCEVWRKQWEVRSVKCGLWSVKCEVWSVKCDVWSLKSAVWSEVWSVTSAVWSVKCGVWSMECEESAVRSVECEVELQMWHVKQDATFAECTHARAWLAHGACKFYRWERSSSISLRQLPPRLVRVLLVYTYNMIFISSNFKDNLFQLYNVISIFNFKLVQYNFISLLRNCGNQQQVVQKKLSASICKLQQLPATFPLGWSIHMMHILQHHLDISIQ